MASGAFHQLGNLLFYDGWHPDYVYFNSLLQIKMEQDHTQNSAYRIDKASQIAQEAVHDAQRMMTFGSQDHHDTYFQQKIEMICTFLRKAIKIERDNEVQYFTTMFNDFKKHFPDKLEDIKAVQDVLNIIKKNQKNKESFDYDEFIKGINILKSGLKNAQEMFAYENKRLEKLTPTINSIFDSRKSQTEGLLTHYHKSAEEVQERAEKSRERLKRKYIIEYSKTGRLTRRREKGRGRYELWGAGKIEDTIPKAIDRVLEDWANKTISNIINQREFLDQIIAKMQIKYPYNGDFKLLERDVQQRIILAIVSYGVDNLQTVLHNTMSTELTQKIVNNITEDDSDFLDLSSEIKIDGLEDNNFGLFIKETKLFEKAEDTEKLLKGSGQELYAALERTLKITEKKQNKTLLQELLENSSRNGKTTNMQDVESIIELINYVSKIKKEMDRYEADFKRSQKRKMKKINELERQSKIDARIKFVINGGKVEVDADSLKKLKDIVGGTTGFQALGFNVDSLNSQSLTSMIRTLKAQASRQTKKIIAQAVDECVEKRTKKLNSSKIINILKKEMSKETIRIDGPDLAELIPGLQLQRRGTRYYFDWNHYKGKNDSVEIIINTTALASAVSQHIADKKDSPLEFKQITEDLVKALEGPLAEARRDYLSTIQTHLNKTINRANNENHKNRYSEIAGEYLQVLKRSGEDRKKINNAYRRFKDAVTKWADQYAKGDEQVKKGTITTLLNSIESSIYVSNTNKSANNYWNELGAKGGSLGGNMTMQLNNIQDIFTQAGMPIPENEMQWLNSAILNCFPGSVVKEANKLFIEEYLGSLIAFALFDEGGVEGRIVDHLYQELQKNERQKFGAKNMHLYIIDSIYYPGSFVLQRTLDEIEHTIVPQISQIDQITHKGAGILIVNQASEGMIKNRPIQKTENPSSDVWAATGQAVKNNVDIRILFLAGLMDVVKRINTSINNIQT